MYKKIVLLMVFFLGAITTVSAQREKLDQLFDRYQDAEGITSIKIAKPMFSMLNKLDIGDGELDQIKPLLAKINALKILVVEKPNLSIKTDKNQQTILNYKAVQEDIRSLVLDLKYQELMSVNNKDNKIKFLSAGAKDGVLDDLILNISSNDNTVLVMLDGKISMDDVNKLVNETQNFTSTNNKTNSSTSTVINRNSEERNVGNFTGIKVSSGIKVNFSQGNTQEVRVETDQDKLNYIKTEIKNGVLNIYVDNPNNKNLIFNKIFVNVVAPEIDKISTLTGANLTVLNTLNSDEIDLECTSGSLLNGDFNIKNTANVMVTSGANFNANLKSNQLNFEATSGSNAVINGHVSQANFEVTSAATCNAQNLIVENSNATVTSAGNLSINVTGNLKADASSSGKIRYKGNPKNISGNIEGITGGKLVKF